MTDCVCAAENQPAFGLRTACAKGGAQEFPLEWYSTKNANPQIQRFRRPNVATGYTPFVEAVVRAGAGLADPPLNADDSLYVLKTIFACYKAAETGQTQSVI